MSTEQLNDLLRRAIESLQDERATLVTFEPQRLLLPESYWREQRQVSQNVFIPFQAPPPEPTVTELMAQWEDDVPTLWAPKVDTGWGTIPMHRSGGMTCPPTKGEQQPSFNYECYQCGRPITDGGKDHAGRTRCDHALMLDVEPTSRYHQAKACYGEEQDEEEVDDDA